MSFVAAAVVGSAVVGGYAASKAAKTTANAANNANQLAQDHYNQMRSDEATYMGAGNEATDKLRSLLGIGGDPTSEGYGSLTKQFTADDYLNNQDPSYGFLQRQMDQSVQNRNAAGSGALSGAALKDLASYTGEYAKTGYQAAYDRWNTSMNNTYARLSGIASMGQNAATQTGSAGVQIGQQQSANTTAAGNAAAGADVAIGNLAGQAGSDYAVLRTIKP